MNPCLPDHRWLPTLLLLAIGLTPLDAFAQQPFGLRSSQVPPRYALVVPRDGTDNPQSPALNGSEPLTPLMLRPGLYVLPGQLGPDYWSPLLRRFPDYNPRAQGFNSRESYYGPLYSGYTCDPGAYCPPTGVGCGNGYGWGYSPYYGDTAAAYEQGRYDADYQYMWYIAAQRAGGLLNQYRELFQDGLLQFYYGHYDWAAVKLLGAAEKNQANGASRLHAGHALFALGRYDEATKLIARAFELSPSLISKQYDIRDEYENKADFDKHLAALKSYVRAKPDDAAGQTLLGYVMFYSEGPGSAYGYLKEAARLDPKSYFIPKLLGLAEMGRGMPATPSAETTRPAEAKNDTARPQNVPARVKPKAGDKGRSQDAVDENPYRQVRAGPSQHRI